MLKTIKAVLFDMDGTLIDSMWVWREIDREYLGRFGLEVPAGFQNQISGMSFFETAQCFKKTFSIPDSVEEMMAEWNAMALEKYQTCVPLKPGAMAFLAYLRKTGRKMAICTSNSRYLTETVLCALHIQDFFDAVLTADDHLEGKPSPDIYLQACKQLETEAESCLVFEDIYKGVLAGRRADMKVCAVRDAFSEDEWPGMEEMADYAIRDFTELEPLFQ